MRAEPAGLGLVDPLYYTVEPVDDRHGSPSESPGGSLQENLNIKAKGTVEVLMSISPELR